LDCITSTRKSYIHYYAAGCAQYTFSISNVLPMLILMIEIGH
jgi:hypothetical protein